MRKKIYTLLLGLVAVGALAGAGAYWYSARTPAAVIYSTPQEADPYVRFVMEGYDSITANYWMKPEQFTQFGLPGPLPMLFQLSAKQVTGKDTPLATTTRAGVAEMLAESYKAATSTDNERLWALQTVALVVNTLIPAGRNQVLSTAQEQQLREEVSNIDKSSDLYGNLGLQKGADKATVAAAYEHKAAELKQEDTPEAKAELEKLAYAHDVLTDDSSKALYDEAQIEPTVFTKTMGRTLYMYVQQISPTTLSEIARAADKASTTPVDSLILDVRGNIGGALDFATAFLGLFIGPNQYAYDLYHQADYQPQRTTLDRFAGLARFKGNMAMLTDNMTQSTAEITSAIFKRYNIARIVGATTRGWGSVENTYPLATAIDPSATYTLLLVNSLTLGDTNQPIEENGVSPDISIADRDWRTKLAQTFSSQSLVAALSQVADKPPAKK